MARIDEALAGLTTYGHGYAPHMAGYGIWTDDCCEMHRGTGDMVLLQDVRDAIAKVNAESFPVTDDLLDAPDGARLTFERHGGAWEPAS